MAMKITVQQMAMRPDEVTPVVTFEPISKNIIIDVMDTESRIAGDGSIIKHAVIHALDVQGDRVKLLRFEGGNSQLLYDSQK
jgi:hypothetical protein